MTTAETSHERPSAEIEARKAAACAAFWSDRPLNVMFRQRVGERAFSLKEFLAFVLEMPAEQFAIHHQ